jgi:hypothetical protein
MCQYIPAFHPKALNNVSIWQVFWLEALLKPSLPFWGSGKSSTSLLFLSLPFGEVWKGFLQLRG